MSYKYSAGYDDIIDVRADAEFIWNLHLLEQNVPYRIIWEQMRRMYELECNERKLALMPARGKETWYEEEYHLNYQIQSRAHNLIEVVKMKYLIAAKKNNDSDLLGMVEEYERLIVKQTISILKTCLFLFDVKGTNVIFGKVRNIEYYQQMYQELSSAQPELQEQGKQKLFPSLIPTQK